MLGRGKDRHPASLPAVISLPGATVIWMRDKGGLPRAGADPSQSPRHHPQTPASSGHGRPCRASPVRPPISICLASPVLEASSKLTLLSLTSWEDPQVPRCDSGSRAGPKHHVLLWKRERQRQQWQSQNGESLRREVREGCRAASSEARQTLVLRKAAAAEPVSCCEGGGWGLMR